jgi:hypothetical protein
MQAGKLALAELLRYREYAHGQAKCPVLYVNHQTSHKDNKSVLYKAAY